MATLILDYHNDKKKIQTPEKLLYHPKIGIVLFYYRVIDPKDADGMANSVDPDQTALGAI